MNPASVKKASEPKVPEDLRKALAANLKARAQWKTLTSISRRDFITWVDSAKQAETHKRRIVVAISKLASGQRRPCCYAVVPMQLYRALDAAPKAKAQWKSLTPDERRDLVAWVNSAEGSEERKSRVEKACSKLAGGKQRP
jgi:uncharacterized protein YdeI (YjbR/CyaY-like superfamily)